MSSHQGKLKNNDEVCLLNNCTDTVNGSLLMQMARMEMDCILKYLASNYSIHLKVKPKMYHGLTFLQKID